MEVGRRSCFIADDSESHQAFPEPTHQRPSRIVATTQGVVLP